MKQHNFVKYHPGIDRITGSQQGTLILSALEYWFIKKSDGFYKFMEPCSHRLYKKGDSWLEEVGLSRKRFARAFVEFGIKYHSRSAFEKAEDKFEGKLYASYYDCHTNQMFFIRNHDLANEILKPFFRTKRTETQLSGSTTTKSADSLPKKPLSTGHNGLSYKDTKITSRNLSKDKSHAEEIIKKMIEIWTALVEEGRGQIELTSKRIAFLKKAFVDKFDSCLENWKKYCENIASSRFLMGEVNNFRATLDWILKFENIQKILDGNYGVGDRTPKAKLVSEANIQQEILTSGEAQEIKDFRTLCLKTVGSGKYLCYFKPLTIEFRGRGEIALIAPHKFAADHLERNCYSYLRVILQGLGIDSKNITLLAPGETRGRLIERERGGDIAPALSPVSMVELPVLEELSDEEIVSEDEALPEVSLETQALRAKLRENITHKLFPSWLGTIEVDEIGQDGTVVVTFEDQLIVDYCEVRFSQQILACAKELWQNIEYLAIQEKPQGLKVLEPASLQNMLKETPNYPEYRSIRDDAEFLLNMVGQGHTSKEDFIEVDGEVSSELDEGSTFYQGVNSLNGMSLAQSGERKIESLERLHPFVDFKASLDASECLDRNSIG